MLQRALPTEARPELKGHLTMTPARFRLVVCSGPTREWIDPVRYISNASSGRTGWHLASRGLAQFRETVFISGPADPAFSSVDGALNLKVETTAEMAAAVREQIGPDTLLIMAAAPADYTPENTAEQKMKKKDGEGVTIQLKPTTDILKSIVSIAPRHARFFRVGFAAETGDLEGYARRKLKEKDLDFICANEVYRNTRGFGDGDNSLFVIDRAGNGERLGPCRKDALAEALLQHIIHGLPD